jgi:6-pyruvoyl-tetrahydropterin synthase related domain
MVAAAVAVAPQLLRSNSCGHDFDFHLVSWFDCLQSWRHGILYPHWTPSANYGAGEPRFVFYPPLIWMLGAALGAFLPWPLVPIALTFLLLAAAGLATRALAREALADAPATLAGCVALFSGYALFTAYERSDFAELTGGFWIPLLLLFVLRDRNPSGMFLWRALDRSALPLALVIAGTWLSNPPVGIMACYLLAATALLLALLYKSFAPLIRASIAAVLGLALSAVYLVPAAIEQPWAAIRQLIDHPGEMIQNSWLFARHADPALAAHDVVLRSASFIAVAMIAVTLIALVVSWRRCQLAARRRWWIPLAVLPFVILFLQFPISLPFWNLLPKMRFLQFPWRWLLVLEAPMAIFFATAVWPVRRGLRFAVSAASAVFFLASTTLAGWSFFQVCDQDDAVVPMVSVFRSGAGFAGVDEYAPPGADNSLLATGLPAACLVSNPSTILGAPASPDADNPSPEWTPSQHSCQATFAATTNQAEHMRIAGNIPHPGYLVLRLRSYPAWRVRVNGHFVSALPRREDGLIAVPVPRGAVSLAVDWTTTPDVLLGRWLSGLTVLALTALGLTERRLSRTRLS